MLRRLAAILALTMPLAAYATAVVEFTQGEVRADNAPVSQNQRIFSGTEINTGANSRLVLAFDDGGKIVLEQNTRFRLVSFRYQQAAPAQDHAAFDLLKGALRAVTGVLAQRNRQLYALRTPHLNIGVRGTDFMVAVADGSYVNVVSGQVALTNGGGTAVFGPGSLASAASNAALAAPVSASSLPAVASSSFQSMGSMTIAGGSASGAVAGTAAGAGLGVAGPVVFFGAAVAGAAGALKGDEDTPAATTHH